MIVDRSARLYALAMRLRQFGRLQIGRLLGTVSNEDGRYKAWIDLLERSYFMRAELNAITKVLLDAGIINEGTWQKALDEEFTAFVADLSKQWPEVEVAEDGRSFTIRDLGAWAERCKREGWPP